MRGVIAAILLYAVVATASIVIPVVIVVWVLRLMGVLT